MPSKLWPIMVRMKKIHALKFQYVASVNGRSASKEANMLMIKHIEQYELEFGKISNAKLMQFLKNKKKL